MPRIAVGVEYDGPGLAGWQTQRDLPTVQGCLESALARVADAPVAIVGAGRTDAGVHARGQVAHFDTDARRSARSWVLGANTHLPPGIALRWAQEVPDHFHARYSAQWRCYRYIILNRSARPGLASGRVAFFHRPLDVQRMQDAVPHLLGEHDFSAFRSSECQANSPIRHLMDLQLRRVGDFIGMEVRANAFLHHMVRNIAGTLAAIGQGDRDPGWAAEVLASRDRRLNAATAPAEGLYFWSARYPDGFGLPDDSDMMHAPAGCPADLMG
ncbi:MAG: tRNA pseudouridine synthase [Pseudomonadota bacterium]